MAPSYPFPPRAPVDLRINRYTFSVLGEMTRELFIECGDSGDFKSLGLTDFALSVVSLVPFFFTFRSGVCVCDDVDCVFTCNAGFEDIFFDSSARFSFETGDTVTALLLEDDFGAGVGVTIVTSFLVETRVGEVIADSFRLLELELFLAIIVKRL